MAQSRAVLQHDEARQVAADCAALLQLSAAQRALQLVQVQLQAQGMRLLIQGCPFVRTQPGQMQQVLDVRVEVVDSDVAADYVRGPLADAEEVDMGDVQLAAAGMVHSLKVVDDDVSPDVLFNRQWLAGVMRARGLQGVTGHWWAFTVDARH